MSRFARLILAAGVLVASAVSAFGQSSILNSGAVTPGHGPMYVQGGIGSQTVVTDSGSAGGGPIGLGYSENLIVARGTGTAPYSNQGTGPLGTIDCRYDAPITNATGYHYLCFSPNTVSGGTTGGLIAYGAGGAAGQLPLLLNINGTTYQFPFSIGGIVGPGTTTVGGIVVWNNASGTLVKDTPPLQIFGTVGAGTLLANPTVGSAFPQFVTLDPTLGFSGTTLKCTTATNSQLGCARPDNTTITVSGGVISAVTQNVTLLNGNVLTKTGAYPAVSADCGSTFALGGSAQYTLTLNAASGYTTNCGFLITNNVSETRTKTLAVNGLVPCFLYPGQTVMVVNENNTWVMRGDGNPSGTSCSGRWRVSATTNFYVRPDGNDSNDGLANSSSGAYLTANAAFNAISTNVDINNQIVNVNHTCGSPPCTITVAAQLLRLVNVQFVGGTPAYVGDCSAPTNVKLNPSTPVAADILIDLTGGGQPTFNVCGFELAGGANSGIGVYVSGTANVMFNSLMQCDGMSATTSGGYPVGMCYAVGNGAHLVLESNQTIAGSVGAVLMTFNGGMIEAGTATTWTITGTPNWTSAFIYAVWNGAADVPSMTFVGSATGLRFLTQWGGSIMTGLGTCTVASTYFPGNTNGAIGDTTGNRGNCF